MRTFHELEEKAPAKKAYKWTVVREVEFDDGTVELYKNTVPADTIEEAVEEANDRNCMNLMLRHVERAQTVKAELIRDGKEDVFDVDDEY